MEEKKYFILNLNPGYDQWHVIRKKPAVSNVFRADEVQRVISGKGLNVARVLNNLGYREYVCLNILGGETGRIISEQSKAEHLNCLEFHIHEESRINTCVTLEYEGKTISYNDPGPILSGEEVLGLIGFVKERIRAGGPWAVVVSGAPCRGITEGDFRKILDCATVQGDELIIDVAGEWLRVASEFPLKMMKVNREEFNEAFQMDAFLFTDDLKRFKERHNIENLVITDGKNGCVAYGKYGECIHSKIEGIQGGCCTVGSGDSFLGGYLKEDGQGAKLSDCLVSAGACGLANTYKYGPAAITKEEVEQFEKYITIIEER